MIEKLLELDSLEEIIDAFFKEYKVKKEGDKIILTPKKQDDAEDKINALSDDTFVAICESIGKDKIKEMSDNNNYQEFVDEAIKWIENKIDKLTEEIDMLEA